MRLMRRKNRDQQVTFMIIPESSVNPRNYTLSKRSIKRIAAGATVLMVVFIILGYSFISGLDSVRYIQNLKTDNSNKEATIIKLEAEITQLNKEQELIQKKQNNLRSIMGLPATNTSSREYVETNQEQTANNQPDRELIAQQMGREIKSLQSELDTFLVKARKNPTYYRSTPNLWPVQGELSSAFGYRKSPMGGSNSSFHDGVDIASQVGTKIASAGDGTVVFSGRMAVYGQTIIIDHGNGLQSKYGHNSQLLVKKGSRVKKGEVIARMGSTGRSTGPHLHFSIYKNGQTVDPMQYLLEAENN